MSGISVGSGLFRFDDKPVQPPSKDGKKLKALVLADFSGRGNRNEIDLDGLLRRRLLQIDKDSFEEVFSKLNVRLTTPLASSELAFDDIDEFHPEYLYENLAVFEHYQRLKRNLGKPNRFESAVAELRNEGIIEPRSTAETPAPEVQDLSLDNILGSTTSKPKESDIQALIRKTVAPYLEPKDHPKKEEYVAAVERAEGDLMRSLLHEPDFSALEASWRGVDLVNRRVDTDRACNLFILDVNLSELHRDLSENQTDITNSVLYEKLINRLSSAGSQTFDVIVFDFPLHTAEASKCLTMLCNAFEGQGTLILSGKSLENARESQACASEAVGLATDNVKNVFVATPGFMLRLPYGKRTSVVDGFDFEELSDDAGYLWGNAAYLLLINLANSINSPDGRLQYIEQLPLHVYTAEGDAEVTPCAQKYLSLREVEQLEASGYTVIQSVKNADKVLIAKWQDAATCATPTA